MKKKLFSALLSAAVALTAIPGNLVMAAENPDIMGEINFPETLTIQEAAGFGGENFYAHNKNQRNENGVCTGADAYIFHVGEDSTYNSSPDYHYVIVTDTTDTDETAYVRCDKYSEGTDEPESPITTQKVTVQYVTCSNESHDSLKAGEYLKDIYADGIAYLGSDGKLYKDEKHMNLFDIPTSIDQNKNKQYELCGCQSVTKDKSHGQSNNQYLIFYKENGSGEQPQPSKAQYRLAHVAYAFDTASGNYGSPAVLEDKTVMDVAPGGITESTMELPSEYSGYEFDHVTVNYPDNSTYDDILNSKQSPVNFYVGSEYLSQPTVTFVYHKRPITISFASDVNGSLSDDRSVDIAKGDSLSKLDGGKFEMPAANPNDASKYIFRGWSLTDQADGIIGNMLNHTFTESTTLTAIFAELPPDGTFNKINLAVCKEDSLNANNVLGEISYYNNDNKFYKQFENGMYSGDILSIADFNIPSTITKNNKTYEKCECLNDLTELELADGKIPSVVYYKDVTPVAPETKTVTVKYLEAGTNAVLADSISGNVPFEANLNEIAAISINGVDTQIAKTISGYNTPVRTNEGDSTILFTYTKTPVIPDNGGDRDDTYIPTRPSTPNDEVITDEETPLAPAPSEDEVILDNETPLAPAPSDDETIEDEATPLANAPQTGRTAGGFGLLTIACAAAALLLKKKNHD